MLRILLISLAFLVSLNCQARNTRYYLAAEGILDKQIAKNNLQDKDIKIGTNAIIDLKNDYKENELETPEKYECHAGVIVSAVSLKGTPVVLV